jgi:AcrR family transcriptional regulator
MTPAKPRRGRGEARQAILESARELFGRNGYRGTSMRDISKHADVNETLIFRNFETKQALFDEAIARPYQSFLDDWLKGWRELDVPRSRQELTADFVIKLYDFVVEHRDALFALVAAQRFNDAPPDSAAGQALFADQVRDLAERMATEGQEGVDHEIAVASTVAMIVAMVLLEDSLFPPGRHPDKDRLLRGMGAYIIAGGTRQHAEDRDLMDSIGS